MRHAETVQEAVEQLKEAQTSLLYAVKGMATTNPRDAWGTLKEKCQQLSGWIEHGRGVTEDMKPELTKTLYAAEKVLLDNQEYSTLAEYGYAAVYVVLKKSDDYYNMHRYFKLGDSWQVSVDRQGKSLQECLNAVSTAFKKVYPNVS
jgi:hypothetical protein